jgi:predicted ATPase
VKNDWAREVLLVSRNPRQLENVNFHLSQLDVPYRLNFVEVPLDGLPQIALSTRPLIPYFIDRDTGVEVFARDIGYGVSQVLPVVIACSDSRRNSHVMVEQPELHLHPRVQSRLADLFFSAINQGLQLSVETHSEHLIYRAQRLIREGKAQSSQICINYVERTRLGSVVHRLRLGDSGNFLDAWPGGFFDERLEELLS